MRFPDDVWCVIKSYMMEDIKACPLYRQMVSTVKLQPQFTYFLLGMYFQSKRDIVRWFVDRFTMVVRHYSRLIENWSSHTPKHVIERDLFNNMIRVLERAENWIAKTHAIDLMNSIYYEYILSSNAMRLLRVYYKTLIDQREDELLRRNGLLKCVFSWSYEEHLDVLRCVKYTSYELVHDGRYLLFIYQKINGSDILEIQFLRNYLAENPQSGMTHICDKNQLIFLHEKYGLSKPIGVFKYIG
jgi:hypothetical protein